MTRQQRRAASRNSDSPWRNIPVTSSARDRNRARFTAKRRRLAEEAAKASQG